MSAGLSGLPPASSSSRSPDGMMGRLFQGPVWAALGSLCNFLLLNLALLVASLPVLTVPMALNAAMVALERWRADGEDRVLREFITVLRSAPAAWTTAVVGTPLVVAAVGVEEVHFFVHSRSMMGQVCLGFGLSALVLALTAFGYVLVLAMRHPGAPASALWSSSLGLAVRNLHVTGPLFLLEIAGAVLLGFLDPALLLLGLPLGLLQLMRLTARLGLRRAGADETEARDKPLTRRGQR